MNRQVINGQHHQITLESVALMAALVAMLSVVASLIFGAEGLIFGPLSIAMFYLLQTRAPIDWVLRAHGAVPLPPYHGVSQLFSALKQRAGIGGEVRLYYSPSNSFNAYTIGHEQETAIVLNAPIMQYFTEQEIAGILAHELSHVTNRDTRYMAMAASLTAMISQICFVVVIFSIMTFPIAIAQGQILSSLATALIALALPSVAIFLHAKLSQNREFAADLGATEILGDPRHLINALAKLERFSGGLLLPWIRRTQGYFGSHPHTTERIERLEAYGRHYPDHYHGAGGRT